MVIFCAISCSLINLREAYLLTIGFQIRFFGASLGVSDDSLAFKNFFSLLRRLVIAFFDKVLPYSLISIVAGCASTALRALLKFCYSSSSFDRFI